MKEISIPRGPSWQELAGKVKLPEHEITRIKTYLKAVGSDDLVWVEWFGAIAGSLEEGEVVDRLLIVGQDGAGRRLRRRDFSVKPKDLLEDVAAIYLCAAKQAETGEEIRYVFVDCQFDGKPLLVCRRLDFETVFETLRAGSGEGNVWRGDRQIDAEEWQQVSEESYLFADGLLTGVDENTVQFIKGSAASLLLRWDVPPKRGVLLYGKPGNGKTIISRLAAKRAIAADVNVVFLDVRELWNGVGDDLRLAATRSPVLVILDDIDVYCGRRLGTSEPDSFSGRRQRFLADLLEFLDGVEPTDGYVLLATTNDLTGLDEALLRPGRLDVHIEVKGPSAEHRTTLLRQSISGKIEAPVPGLTQAVDLLDGCAYADVVELAKRYKIAVTTKYQDIAVDQGLFDSLARDFADEIFRTPPQI